MDFLKAIYGDKALTYDELVTAISTFNGDEANKDKQIKVGNLGTGEYVSKGKYDDLQAQLNGKQTELDTANGLIAELKKSNKGDEELQGKITTYETQVAELQKELAETKIKSAVKVALLSEKAVDVDYLTYKLNEKLRENGESLALDENDNIKGWNDKLSGLKVQFPSMFEGGSGSNGEGYVPVESKGLPKDSTNKTVTKEQFLKMSVDERIALKQKDENLYKSLRG